MIPISEVEVWGGELVPDFTFEAVSIPAGVSHNFQGFDCDVDSVFVPSNSGHLWCWVKDSTHNLVGWAIFAGGTTTVLCCQIELDELVRGKKIAFALYRFAACLFAAPVVPNPPNMQSDEAKAFWNGRTSLIC